MINKLIVELKKDEAFRNKFQSMIIIKDIPTKTILLNEGDIAQNIYFINKGCLREWFNKDGKDITFQFFFEGQAVASIDSLLSNQPSIYSIESIEASKISSLSKKNFELLQELYPEDYFQMGAGFANPKQHSNYKPKQKK